MSFLAEKRCVKHNKRSFAGIKKAPLAVYSKGP